MNRNAFLFSLKYKQDDYVLFFRTIFDSLFYFILFYFIEYFERNNIAKMHIVTNIIVIL